MKENYTPLYRIIMVKEEHSLKLLCFVLYGAAPYDDRLVTGCERCIYEMYMGTQPTTLITINPE